MTEYGCLHLCWFMSVGCWITWLISSWEEKNCCQSRANFKNDNYFHSSWQLLKFVSENNCHLVNLLRFDNSYFLLSFFGYIMWFKSQQQKANTDIGPLHVIWQVSFGCWVTWSISSWQKYYKTGFFPKDEWWVAELIFLSLNNWGLNFLQNECSQSSQIYLSPEKLRKMFAFQSCKLLNHKIDQNINFAK